MSKIKQECEQYLGNRGIYQPVKRCAKYDRLWFILFEDDTEVEVSFEGWCYECYDFIKTPHMKWNKAFYAKVQRGITRQQKAWAKIALKSLKTNPDKSL